FFLSVLLHELAHSFVSIKTGVPVRDITLFVFGGAAQISQEPKSALNEFLMAVAGPMTSIALGVLFAAAWVFARFFSEPLAALSLYLAGINVLLGFFNLVPGFPLDGGRVLRSILWGLGGDMKQATRWASLVGRLVAYLMIFAGIWRILGAGSLDGLWWIFLGWFLDNAANSSYQQVATRSMLEGHTVREIMTSECSLLPEGTSLQEVVEGYLLPMGRRCFPVVRGGELQGLLTLHNLKAVPQARWSATPEEQIMTPVAELKSVKPDDGLWAALSLMTEDGVNQLPVMEGGRLVGMLARDHILTFIRTRAELGI
ncbi:MAG: CBS domain-containing protein, partial [Chloroflexi bacterium]|nr:CBS domain-containing protein [Chloroflexota bacterium]